MNEVVTPERQTLHADMSQEEAYKMVIGAGDELNGESPRAGASVGQPSPAPSPDELSVLGAGDGPAPMPTQQDREQAWRRLYIARMVAAGVPEEGATASFEACGLGPDGYDIEDDPEDCADDEMSYWGDDGDE